jgi:prepilin-type N-terminal cleavage/methylation domain-containing protein
MSQRSRAFTLIEILIVMAIMAIVITTTLTTLVSFNRRELLNKDVDTIVSITGQARSQTLASKNGATYGVHLSSTTVILFAGTSYISTASSNQLFPLRSRSLTVTPSLNGGGSDVMFKRLTGETDQFGTITATSASTTKTVTIYKTGIIQSK